MLPLLDILSEMKKINHSILVNFLELLDTLIDSSLQHEVTVWFGYKHYFIIFHAIDMYVTMGLHFSLLKYFVLPSERFVFIF